MPAQEAAEAFLIVAKRLLKWSGVGLLALGVVGGLAFWAFHAYEAYKNRPFPVVVYQDVQLGHSQQEVLYALGQPTYVLVKVRVDANLPWTKYAQAIRTNELPAGKSIHDYQSWIFETDQKAIDFDFDAPRGKVVGVGCMSKGSWNCPALFGLRDGSSEEEVLAQLGAPGHQDLLDAVKRLRYPQFNVSLYLEKRRVYMIRVSQGAALSSM